MKTPSFSVVISTVAMLGMMPRDATAWDPAGHLIIGEIAWQKAAPTTREKVEKLVALLPNQHNANRPYHFATSGCWMDDMRAEPHYAWGPLHYVTVAYTPTGSAFQEPAPPNVLSGIDEALLILKNPDALEAKRVEALGMLIHFIGDVHQPIHVTDWNDKGGNGYLLMGVPFSDLMKRQVSNLHTFWDKAFRFDAQDGNIVEKFGGDWIGQRPEHPGEGAIHDEAVAIMAESPESSLPQLGAAGDVRAWARESHMLGCLVGYPPGPHPTNAEVVKVTPEFVQKARVVARERMALAGYRLARMLDELFAK